MKKKYSKHMQIVVFITLSLISSLIILFMLQSYEHDIELENFTHSMDKELQKVEKDVEHDITLLYALKSHILFQEDFTREEFHQFALEVLPRYKDILAISWVPKIAHKDRSMVEKMGQKYYPDFHFKSFQLKNVTTSPKKHFYFPIFYIAPYKGNEDALGFDLMSHPKRIKALKKAAIERKAIATPAIQLVQEKSITSNFLIVLPVIPIETNNLHGFVTAIMNYKDLISNNFSNELLQTTSLTIKDKHDRTILYQNHDTYKTSPFVYKTSIKIGGRSLLIEAYTKDKEWSSSHKLSISVMILGMIIFTLTFLLFKTEIKKRIIAHRQSEDLANLVKKEIKKSREKDKRLLQQSRLAQVGEMINMIAHQWRQPLSAISTSVIDIEVNMELNTYNTSETENDKKFQAYLKSELRDIHTFVTGLSQTIDDFRSFNKKDKEFSQVNIQEVVDHSLRIVQAELDALGIELIQKHEKGITADIYFNEMIQVFLNILGNAIENINEKHIKNPQIKLQTKREDNHCIIEISDNGGGIDENILPYICDPYFSTKDKKNGTGLGLYMSKTIIEDHHKGEFTITNDDNGARFIIKL